MQNSSKKGDFQKSARFFPLQPCHTARLFLLACVHAGDKQLEKKWASAEWSVVPTVNGFQAFFVAGEPQLHPQLLLDLPIRDPLL